VPGEELNYRRADERLFITQPALSTAIKQLLHQFGVALVTRNTLEVALTDEGRAWLPRVQRALHLRALHA
jgi:DNA-binding transcriptional LysR family regulator